MIKITTVLKSIYLILGMSLTVFGQQEKGEKISISDSIFQVQTILSDLGYNIGMADGMWGRKSENALQKFLLDNGQDYKGGIEGKIHQLLQLHKGHRVKAAWSEIPSYSFIKDRVLKNRIHFNGFMMTPLNGEYIKLADGSFEPGSKQQEYRGIGVGTYLFIDTPDGMDICGLHFDQGSICFSKRGLEFAEQQNATIKSETNIKLETGIQIEADVEVDNIDDDEQPPPDFVPFEKEPQVIRRVEPVYPELARKAGLEGTVWVKLWVDREGKVKEVVILKSASEILNKPSIDAAKQWLFTPALLKTGPVSVWISLSFNFKLNAAN